DLEVILRLRIELGTDVVSAHSGRHIGIQTIVRTAASLKREGVLAASRNLWPHVQTAHKSVRPRLPAALLSAPCDATTGGVEQILGATGGNLRPKSRDNVAFDREPVVHEVGQGCIETAQICIEESRAETDVFVSQCKLETVILAIAKVKSRSRLRFR